MTDDSRAQEFCAVGDHDGSCDSSNYYKTKIVVLSQLNRETNRMKIMCICCTCIGLTHRIMQFLRVSELKCDYNNTYPSFLHHTNWQPMYRVVKKVRIPVFFASNFVKPKPIFKFF